MIKYLNGDLFEHVNNVSGLLIPHVVNNIKKWGAGFVVPLGRRFPCVRTRFLESNDVALGSVDYIVSEGNVIANMYAQNGIRNKYNPQPLCYNALLNCMIDIRRYINDINASSSNEHDIIIDRILAPKFGAGLSGGDFTIIEQMVNNVWYDIDVTIFEF